MAAWAIRAWWGKVWWRTWEDLVNYMVEVLVDNVGWGRCMRIFGDNVV